MLGESQSPKPLKIIARESSGKQLIELSRVRLVCVIAFFLLCFVAISIRLVEVSVFNKTDDSAMRPPSIDASSQEALNGEWNTPMELSRLDIVDRNGVVVATSLNMLSLFANPKVMVEPYEAARKLSSVFPEMKEKDLKKRLTQNNTFVWIKRNLTPKEQHSVNNLGIPGLYFQAEQRRVYPHANLMSHIIGYVGVDNKGLAGIEKHFDKKLLATKYERDALQLSVDVRVQHIVHDELSKAISQFSAIGGVGVVMDIKSGELISMCNLPDFNPHEPGRASDDAKFNRASLGNYEMGSTFKTFTTAMALDYGIVTMHDGYDASNPIKIARYTISDTHPKNRWLSIPEIYAYSSNIGTVKMILDVGAKRQQEFLKKFGMFEPVSIEIPEISSPLYPKDWKEINAMTISFGHGMTVSPLNLVRGVAAVVDGGVLMPMTLIKGGNAKKPAGARVMKEATARQMRRLMRMVVQYGTGGKADAEGYRVGGKTGTAEKVQAGGYSKDSKMALFVGAFPTDDPKYVVLVMVDEPKGDKSTYGYATGGWIAAPVAGNIIRRMGTLYGVSPIFDEVPERAEDSGWVSEANRRFLQDVKY
jgi:cell division protein FtsI (penicillin-binding protein 3)